MAEKKHAITRRKFLMDTARTASAVGIAALGLGGYARVANGVPAPALRPPGALDEEQFNAACIRCGLCVRDCPYPTLSLAELGDAVTVGTPFFTAREAPCEMCDDIPCVAACPTGALDHALTDINDSRMGLALISDHEACIAYQGLRCEVCFNVCPVRGKAITLELQHNKRSGMHALFIPVVHSSDCTGCGKCERACILTEAAIKVLPYDLVKGKMQETYRLGWKEKEKLGEALVTPDVKHRFNLPEGERYDYYGKGLIEKAENDKGGDAANKADSPFSANPLDTLNRKGGL
ncbi:MAG TPA: ferredoxin-type protein NapG [Chromatiaceae bacterium]|nr:ferredoxin-type protein NapG [Chromatiaceae bacterium]